MATILFGKNKGKKIQIHQYCNNWVSGIGGVFHITSLLFTDDEIKEIRNCKNTGFMFEDFEIKNNRFYKKRRMNKYTKKMKMNI